MKTKQLLLWAIALMMALPISAATYYVRSTGSDASSTPTSVGTPLLTVAKALGKVTADGDVIDISGSVSFFEATIATKTITKSITIQGDSKTTAIVSGTVLGKVTAIQIGSQSGASAPFTIVSAPTVTIQNLTFQNFDSFNDGTNYVTGGVILLQAGAMTCTNLNFLTNTAYVGGAIAIALIANDAATSTATILDCYFNGNKVKKRSAVQSAGHIYPAGGAISVVSSGAYNNQINVDIERCTFEGNTSEDAGSALRCSFQSTGTGTNLLLVQNCTFANNINKNGGLSIASPTAGRGVIYTDGRSNGSNYIQQPTCDIKFINNTVAYNSTEATATGSIAGFHNQGCLDFTTLKNNIVFSNFNSFSTPQSVSFSFYKNIKESRNNISDSFTDLPSSTTSGVTMSSGNVKGVNAATLKLATAINLTDNGGATKTLALSSGSSAIDLGYATGAPNIDQRNYGRVGTVDVGAFEYLGTNIAGAATATAFNTTYGTASAVQTFPISGRNLTANLIATSPTGLEVSSGGAYGSTASFTQTSGNASGTLSIRLAATASVAGSYNSQNIVLSSTGVTSVNIFTAASGNAVTAKALTITGMTGVEKPYSGTNDATLTGTAVYDGLVNGELPAVTGTPSATFNDVNVGTAKAITVTGYIAPISGNYTLTQPSLSANITTVGLTITGMSGVEKPYSGTNAATLTGTAAYGGLVNGEVPSVTGTPSATFNDVNVGTAKAITVTGYTAPNSNYTLTQPSLSANITTVGLTITGISGVSKIYDGNSTATLMGTADYSGLVNSEVFTVTGTPNANFADAVIGTSKAITVTGFTTPSANYTVSQPTGLTADITAVPITAVPISSSNNETAIPGTTAEVTVSGTSTILSITNDKTVKNVIIEPGAKLNLSAAKTLSITGDLILKATDAASFSTNIGSGTFAVTGAIKYQRTIDASKWFFLSFPSDVVIANITNSVGGSLGVLGTDWFIKYYDGALRGTNGPSNANWVAITNADIITTPTLKLNKYQGYIIGLKNGTLATEVLFPLDKLVLSTESTHNITVAANNAGAISATNHGWNLIGQPYLSNYSGSYTSGAFNIYISDGVSIYTPYTQATVPTMNPMSAYFIQANTTLAGAGITFNTTGRQSVHALVDSNLSDQVQLNFTSPTGTDYTLLTMDNSMTTAYEIGYDLEKWIGTDTTKPQVYSVLGGINYAFNALPMSSVQNLPIGFYTQTAGTTTIAANATQAPSMSKLLLLDITTGITTDLLTTNYTFTADAGTVNTRFQITAQRIATAIILDIDADVNAPKLSIVNNQLSIENLSPSTTARVYDAIGRMVANKTANSNSMEIKLGVKGMYSIQLQSGTNIWTKKVVL